VQSSTRSTVGKVRFRNGPPCRARRKSGISAPRIERHSLLICPSGGLLTGLSSLISDFPKNILVPTHPKSHLEFSHPTPPEGRIMIVTDAGRDAVDAAAFCARRDCRAGWRKARERSPSERTRDVAAYGEVVWS
jgi:hypothetical protein